MPIAGHDRIGGSRERARDYGNIVRISRLDVDVDFRQVGGEEDEEVSDVPVEDSIPVERRTGKDAGQLLGEPPRCGNFELTAESRLQD